MTGQPHITLNDGRSMPQLGFGTWQIPNSDAASIVVKAISTGYRAIDTAAAYENEIGVGRGLEQAGVPPSEMFVTTKLGNSRHGYDQALAAASESLDRLRVPMLDLYLIHWPLPGKDLYVDTWRALIDLQSSGKVGSIGVSNFTVAHLERLIGETGTVPAVNQIELHPRFQQRELRDFHARHGIATQSWSPLGRGRVLDHPTVARLASAHDKTAAQIVLRWHLDSGLIVIPKSVTPARIEANFALFDFRLSDADLDAMAALDDQSGRIGPDPDDFG